MARNALARTGGGSFSGGVGVDMVRFLSEIRFDVTIFYAKAYNPRDPSIKTHRGVT